MRRGISLVLIGFFLTFFCITDVSARRNYFTEEQKSELVKANAIYVNVLALTERGRGDGTPIVSLVSDRLKQLGYAIVTDRKEPHDVEFRVKCEERKKGGGTTRAGGDADHPDNPARLWKGPACLFAYYLNGEDSGWQKEVRTDFEDADAAAKAANAKKSGPYALSQLTKKLKEYDFPVKLAAEWGQDYRLLALLDDPSTPKNRKVTVLSVMTNLQSHKALPYLKDILKDKDLALDGIAAVTTTGSDGIPLLTEIFNDSKEESNIRAAAAKGLGKIGAATGNPSITPPILDYLINNLKQMETSKDIDFPVLTEVVWSLGRLRNEKSIAPMRELEKRVWLIYDTSNEMTELRDAVNWTVKQIDMDGQIQ
ncbi:MAG: HEAT repeat domain-containing protein [Nitrospirales bacterium]|nr:HEAT repeat domain-containing protein [Nitrospira sp.]MDR4502649.1 HEAT repeat domain-containing protein [Nitrospirales bacterium]